MPETCTVRYLSNRAPSDNISPPGVQNAGQTSIILDVGKASREEARWWASVLASGRGWEATLVVGLETFWSPWSIRVQSGPRFIIPRENETVQESFSTPPSFIEALTILDKFCVRHNIIDQSHAALAAVLHLPTMGDRIEGLHLPAVVIGSEYPRSQHEASTPGLRHDWLYQTPNHLDKLLTLSCFVNGIRPMLLGVFYNPNIECNAVSPWLQGTMTVLHALAKHKKPLSIGRMLMDRNPAIAILWVGATILGLQEKLLQDAQLGKMVPNNLSAEWSGKPQSFIHQPVSRPLVVDGAVSLADQCRLLYLSQTEGWLRAPTCPWAPFGSTPLDDVDIEVRLHADCAGHGLQYMGFTWDCLGHGLLVSTENVGDEWEVYRDPSDAAAHGSETRNYPAVDYRGLHFEMEDLSERATRSIFKWLRGSKGFKLGEWEILQHEWFKSEGWAFGPGPGVTSQSGKRMLSGDGSMIEEAGHGADSGDERSGKTEEVNQHKEEKT